VGEEGDGCLSQTIARIQAQHTHARAYPSIRAWTHVPSLLRSTPAYPGAPSCIQKSSSDGPGRVLPIGFPSASRGAGFRGDLTRRSTESGLYHPPAPPRDTGMMASGSIAPLRGGLEEEEDDDDAKRADEAEDEGADVGADPRAMRLRATGDERSPGDARATRDRRLVDAAEEKCAVARWAKDIVAEGAS
jgi:hypothetical protein